MSAELTTTDLAPAPFKFIIPRNPPKVETVVSKPVNIEDCLCTEYSIYDSNGACILNYAVASDMIPIHRDLTLKFCLNTLECLNRKSIGARAGAGGGAGWRHSLVPAANGAEFVLNKMSIRGEQQTFPIFTIMASNPIVQSHFYYRIGIWSPPLEKGRKFPENQFGTEHPDPLLDRFAPGFMVFFTVVNPENREVGMFNVKRMLEFHKFSINTILKASAVYPLLELRASSTPWEYPEKKRGCGGGCKRKLEPPPIVIIDLTLVDDEKSSNPPSKKGGMKNLTEKKGGHDDVQEIVDLLEPPTPASSDLAAITTYTRHYEMHAFLQEDA
jgi:hypothetical protein